MDIELPRIAVAEHLASKIAALDSARLPAAVRRKCEDLLIDVIGLCVTARREPYVKSDGRIQPQRKGWPDRPCRPTGGNACCVNGTAARAGDFNDPRPLP